MFINARMTLLLATAVLNIKQYHHHPYIDKMLKMSCMQLKQEKVAMDTQIVCLHCRFSLNPLNCHEFYI